MKNFFILFTVPIIPEFLYDIRHPDAPLDSYPRTPLTLHTPPPPTQCPCKDGETIPTVEVSTISAEGKFNRQLTTKKLGTHFKRIF